MLCLIQDKALGVNINFASRFKEIGFDCEGPLYLSTFFVGGEKHWEDLIKEYITEGKPTAWRVNICVGLWYYKGGDIVKLQSSISVTKFCNVLNTRIWILPFEDRDVVIYKLYYSNVLTLLCLVLKVRHYCSQIFGTHLVPSSGYLGQSRFWCTYNRCHTWHKIM